MLHCGLYAFKAFIFWNIRISVQDLGLAIYSLLDMINKMLMIHFNQTVILLPKVLRLCGHIDEKVNTKWMSSYIIYCR